MDSALLRRLGFGIAGLGLYLYIDGLAQFKKLDIPSEYPKVVNLEREIAKGSYFINNPPLRDKLHSELDSLENSTDYLVYTEKKKEIEKFYFCPGLSFLLLGLVSYIAGNWEKRDENTKLEDKKVF